jgi:hypothetical protein
MLSKTAIIDVQADLLGRATAILSEISLGLEIMSVDVIAYMQMTPRGPRPSWGIVYQCRGILIGSNNYNMQMTGVDDPFIPEEVLRKGLIEGCDQLRERRSQQGN